MKMGDPKLYSDWFSQLKMAKLPLPESGITQTLSRLAHVWKSCEER